jgi:hypothetical protein
MGSKPLATRLREKRNHPPPGQPWVWLTRELIESEAWRSLSRAARLVIDRVILEHMAHAGTENGNLIVTYDDFEKFGIRRGTLKDAISQAAERGLIVVTEKGRASSGPHRWPSKYALGWLPMKDGSAACNRWTHWSCPSKPHELSKSGRFTQCPESPLYTQDIESSDGSGTGGDGRIVPFPVSKPSLASGSGTDPGKARISAKARWRKRH